MSGFGGVGDGGEEGGGEKEKKKKRIQKKNEVSKAQDKEGQGGSGGERKLAVKAWAAEAQYPVRIGVGVGGVLIGCLPGFHISDQMTLAELVSAIEDGKFFFFF